MCCGLRWRCEARLARSTRIRRNWRFCSCVRPTAFWMLRWKMLWFRSGPKCAMVRLRCCSERLTENLYGHGRKCSVRMLNFWRPDSYASKENVDQRALSRRSLSIIRMNILMRFVYNSSFSRILKSIPTVMNIIGSAPNLNSLCRFQRSWTKLFLLNVIRSVLIHCLMWNVSQRFSTRALRRLSRIIGIC